MPNPLADLVAGFPITEDAVYEGTGLQTVATDGSVNTDSPYIRITSADAATGVIMKVGRRKGQRAVVVNEGANTITMATAATSNVRMGATCAILTLRACVFIWDGTSRWDCVLSA